PVARPRAAPPPPGGAIPEVLLRGRSPAYGASAGVWESVVDGDRDDRWGSPLPLSVAPGATPASPVVCDDCGAAGRLPAGHSGVDLHDQEQSWGRPSGPGG